MKGTPIFRGKWGSSLSLSLIAVAALLTAACFNIVVEEGQPQPESLSVMPVFGDINLLPDSQPSNQETDNFNVPETISVEGIGSPNVDPGPTAIRAPEPLPVYWLTLNGVAAIDSMLTLDGGAVEVSSPPEAPAGLYRDGDLVRLTAIPGEGYRFDAWGGDCAGHSSVCDLTFDGDKDLTVEFAPLDQFFELDLVADPNGGGEVQVDPSPNAPDGKYVDGTQLELWAIDSEGYGFDGWNGACAGDDRKCRIVMNSDQAVTASFEPDFYTLTINRVLVDVAGVSLGHGQIAVFPFIASPHQGYAPSAIVSLTVDPDAGFIVVNWGGDCSGLEPEAPECTLVMDEDKIVEVTFAEETADRNS